MVRGALHDLHTNDRLALCLEHVINKIFLVKVDSASATGIVLAKFAAWYKTSKCAAQRPSVIELAESLT
jgi:hypothetical protein